MFASGGFDVRNLLQGHSLALLGLFIAALILIGIISFSFRGNIVV